jgi:hypothetical protein
VKLDASVAQSGVAVVVTLGDAWMVTLGDAWMVTLVDVSVVSPDGGVFVVTPVVSMGNH